MPIFQYRFGPGIQKLKMLIAAGVAGQACLTTVETAWRRITRCRGAASGRPSAGAPVAHAFHAHDLLT